MTSVQPAHGPTVDSTYGLTNALVAEYNAAAAPTVRAGIDPEHGIMGFFSAGASVSVSDNGTSNAQQCASDQLCFLVLCCPWKLWPCWNFVSTQSSLQTWR